MKKRPIGDLPPDLGVCDACGEVFFAFWRRGATRRTVEARILAGDAEKTCMTCAKASRAARERRLERRGAMLQRRREQKRTTTEERQ